MKIAVIVNHFPPKWLAGTEVATYSLAEHLTKRGHEVHIMTSHDGGLPHFHKEKEFFVHRIAFPRNGTIGIILFWAKIFLEIKKVRPDVVHAQALNTGVPALFAMKCFKIPYIVWGRGSDVYIPVRFGDTLNQLILKNASAILALTNDMKTKINSFYSREIHVVPNGIDIKQSNPTSRSTEVKGRSKSIVFVGRLHQVKGVQYLLTAMKQIHEEIPDTRLILVGDGEERERLQRMVDDYKLDRCVEFVGRVPHEKIPEYLLLADIFVLPSLSEGFPVTILEAMSCGLPIVASRVGGIPDILEDGVNGYMVEAKSSDELAERLTALLKNDEMRMKISNNNLQEVRRYSWESVTMTVESIYSLTVAHTFAHVQTSVYR